jgi:hypothetical protein
MLHLQRLAPQFALLLAVVLGAATIGPATIRAANSVGLGIVRSNSFAMLNWDSEAAVLESASSPAGTWETVGGATSPYSVPATNSGQFFRLRLDCIAAPAGIVS